MSEILGNITDILEWLFKNLLPNWRDLTSVPYETTKSPELEEKLKLERTVTIKPL